MVLNAARDALRRRSGTRDGKAVAQTPFPSSASKHRAHYTVERDPRSKATSKPDRGTLRFRGLDLGLVLNLTPMY